MTGMPVNDWSDSYRFGLGGGVVVDYPITDNLTAGFSVGFLSFSGKGDMEELNANVRILPMQFFSNWHFLPGEKLDFYAGLAIGYSSITSTITFPSVPGFFEGGEFKATASGQSFTPRAGITYNLSDNLGLDMNLGYNINMVAFENEDGSDTGNLNYLGINFGVYYVLDM